MSSKQEKQQETLRRVEVIKQLMLQHGKITTQQVVEALGIHLAGAHDLLGEHPQIFKRVYSTRVKGPYYYELREK